MAYNEGLAQRIRELLQDQTDVEEKKMFGGLCFMISRHMCCGIFGDKIMAKTGPDRYDEHFQKEHARTMDFTGKPMEGMLFVEPEGLQSDQNLNEWIET